MLALKNCNNFAKLPGNWTETREKALKISGFIFHLKVKGLINVFSLVKDS